MSASASPTGRRASAGAPLLEWADLVPHLLAARSERHNLATGMPLEHRPLQVLAQEAMRAAVDDASFAARTSRYHDVRGDPELRALLASLYRDRFELPVTAANVLVVPSAQAAFHYVGLIVRARAGRMRFIAPEYPGYRTHIGVSYDMVPAEVRAVGDDGGEFRHHLPRQVLDADVGAVVLSRPSNPAGTVFADEELAALAVECAGVGALLVVDNAYAPLLPDLAFVELGMPWGEGVVLVHSLSKAALAGERIGFVLADEQLIEELARLQADVVTFPPQLVQLALRLLLRDGRFTELCHTQMRPEYERRHRLVREVLDAELRVPFQVHAADGGQFRWLYLPELRTPSDVLFHELADNGVLVAPSAPFYSPELRTLARARRSFRIGVTAPVPAIEHGLARFAEVADAHC